MADGMSVVVRTPDRASVAAVWVSMARSGRVGWDRAYLIPSETSNFCRVCLGRLSSYL
jgi:hypothetical protein